MTPRCADCRFFEALNISPWIVVSGHGECRRYPPKDVGRIAVTPDFWCGEFVPREPEA
jgi:hypothetical protein